jgi:putative transposase
MGGFHTVPIAE